MEKIVFKTLFLIGILIFSGFGVVATTDETEILKESIVISKPVIQDADNYVKIKLGEATSYTSNAGRPMLPVITRVFTFPFGTRINSVDVDFSEQKEIVLSKEIQPSPELIPLTNTAQNSKKIIKDTEIYGSSNLYPSTSFTYTTGAGLDDGHVIFLSVHVYPIRYFPAKKKITYNDNIIIRVHYEKSCDPTRTKDRYNLVVIAPSIFSQTLKPLINHKNKNNVKTLLKTTEEIYSQYNGDDKAEQIKYFIKDAIETYGIDYVLLVGSVYKIPIRTTWNYKKVFFNYWNESIITDLYYADIYDENGDFCSWDSNENSYYGENYIDCPGNNDEIDLYPDINIGRLPCDNRIEVILVVNKIIKYETQTYDQDWFKRVILLGGDTFPDFGPYEGEVVTENVSHYLSEFEHIKLWTSSYNYNRFNINRKINNGAGFVSYSGHGYEFGFGTSPPNKGRRIDYYIRYSRWLLNFRKYPIFFFDACLTASLDYNIFGIKLPCIAWYLVKKPLGGAIAVVGATRVGFTRVDDEGIHGGAGYMNVHFFKAYEPGITVSQMLTRAQNDYLNNMNWKDTFTIEEFILIGDPSLKVGGFPNPKILNYS